MKILVLLLLTCACANARTWNDSIFDARSGQEISRTELVSRLGTHVFVGEKHYNVAVQNAEAQLLNDWVGTKGLVGRFSLGWEFLAASERTKTELLWQSVLAGQMLPQDFIKKTQGKSGAEYAPLFEAARALGGQVVGLNLTRAEKSPVSQGGLSAADPKLIPTGYQEGSLNYRKRFDEVMAEHVPPEKLNNYWDAQCLTDDVMASEWAKIQVPSFVVMGSFHTDYFDGFVSRVTIRGGKDWTTVRFVDASDYPEKELLTLLNDPKYGPLADFVIFVNEP